LAVNGNIPVTAHKEWDDLPLLIRECIAQNRMAQKKLYDKYAAFVFGIIKRYEYDERVAAEILNDSFFKIFTKLDQFSFQGAFEGWMRRIIINTVTDHLRRNIKEKNMIKQEAKEYDAYVDSGAVEGLAYKELLQLIYKLPTVQRMVFNLFVFESMQHKEIGQSLNITENNSRWYLNDARKRLKDILKTRVTL
jgi:RNA polymerase sigma factor (sigma-70 family)